MAERLEKRDASALDWDHLAEEIRDLGRSFQHSLLSHLRNVQMHLIKWEIQPERRSLSWEDSISNSRAEIDSLLDDFPSLRGVLKEKFDKCYDKAYRQALQQTHLPKRTAYTRWPLEKVIDHGFLPQ
ncbi:MAG: DUF29 domain-containing protein [Bryobacterales bacterium]|nr:DUF29 domain-containing protein [Bryobacterales bacterium]